MVLAGRDHWFCRDKDVGPSEARDRI
jgi:hypothetical protein